MEEREAQHSQPESPGALPRISLCDERTQRTFEGPGEAARSALHASTALGRATPVLLAPSLQLPSQIPDLPLPWEPRAQPKLQGRPLSPQSPSVP